MIGDAHMMAAMSGEIENAERVREQEKIMDGWQLIETAPNDQRSILAVNENSKIQRVCWREEVGSDRYDSGYGQTWKPTHWRPLPDPPTRHLKGKRSS